MSNILYDRVMMTTTTEGVGTLTLSGTVTSYQSVPSSLDGNTSYFCIYSVNAYGNPTGSWEVFQGTYTALTSTLTRTVVLASSNNGSAISFAAGTKRVILTVPASKYILTDGTNSFTSVISGITPTSSSHLATKGYVDSQSSSDLLTAVILSPAASSRNVIQPTAATYIPLTIKGFASQSANLLEIQNSSASILVSISSAGAVAIGGTLSSGAHTAPSLSAASGDLTLNAATGSDFITFGTGTPFALNGIRVGNTAAAYTNLFGGNVRYASGTVQTWSSVANTPSSGNADIGLSRLSAGNLAVGTGAASSVAGSLVAASYKIGGITSSTPMIVNSANSIELKLGDNSAYTDANGKGFFATTGDGNFAGFRNKSGTNGAMILFNGNVNGFDRLLFGGITTSQGGIFTNGAGFDFKLADGSAFTALGCAALTATTGVFVSPVAGSVPLTVKGASSQSGDLLQFQNSSATTLTLVTSAGEVRVGNSINVFSEVDIFKTAASSLAATIAGRKINLSAGSANNYGLVFGSDAAIAWTSVAWATNADSGNLAAQGDTFIYRPAPATIRLGAADAASPVAQTLSVQNASGSDVAGAKFTIIPSISTGAATPASVVIKSTVAGVSSSTAQTLSDTLVVTNGGVSIGSGLTPYCPFEVINSAGLGIAITSWSSGGNAPAKLLLGRSRSNTVGTHSPVATTDVLGAVDFGGDSASANFEVAARITAVCDNVVSGHTFGRLVFYTNTTSGALNEVLRLDSNGAATITLNSASSVGLTVKGASSQSGNLQEWQNSSGTILSSVDASGQLTIGQTGAPGARLKLSEMVTAQPALLIAHGTNSDVLQITKSAGSGNLLTATFTSGQSSGLIFSNTDASTYLSNAALYGFKSTISFGIDSLGQYAGYFTSTQTRDTAGTNFGTPYGVYAAATTTTSGPVGKAGFFECGSARVIGVVVKANGSQSSNLTEWWSSASAVLASVNASGDVTGRYVIASGLQNFNSLKSLNTNTGHQVTLDINDTQAQLVIASSEPLAFVLNSTTPVKFNTATQNVLVTVSGAAIIGQVIKAAASQTANLTEWQNSSSTPYFYVGPSVLAGDSITKNWLNLTATMPTIMSASTNGINVQITGAGSSAQASRALNIDFLAGYTGTSNTSVIRASNANAGKNGGADGGALSFGNIRGNYAIHGEATGVTTGTNLGNIGYAEGGINNVGVLGLSYVAKNSGFNIGVCGFGLNSGTSPVQIGGYFGLHSTTNPTFVSAALICDNGSTTSNIFVARDNGTTVFTIADGGIVSINSLSIVAGTSTGNIAKVGGVIFDHYVDGSSTHTDGTEDILYTDTIPANTLSANGQKIVGEYTVNIVASATATRRIQLYFAGTTILDGGTQTFASGGNCDIYITVIRETSSVVRIKAELVPSGISLQPIVTYTRITGLDFTTTNILKITGIAAGVGAGSADIIAKLGYIEWKQAA